MALADTFRAVTGHRVDAGPIAGAIDHEINEAERRIKEYVDNELAELALLSSTEINKSVYEMSAEEYMRLPGEVRL